MSNKKQIKLFKKLGATANGKSSVIFLNDSDKAAGTENIAKNPIIKLMLQVFIIMKRS